MTARARSALGTRPSESDALISRFEGLLGGQVAPAVPILDIDAADRDQPNNVVEYIKDIYEHLRQFEVKYQPSANYMASQTDITDRMRAILVDWLIDVHLKFKLRHETLFLTINILDRFVEKTKVARNKLQLVGVTSMLVAAKYEEIFPPEIKDFEFICDRAYTREMILDMEVQICNKLNFNFTVATPHTFLKRFVKAVAPEGNDTVFLTVCYLLELAACQYATLRHRPSMLAASAVHLACKMSGLPSWTPTLQHHTGYSESTLRECSLEMNDYHRKALQAAAQGGTSLRAASRKYSAARFKAVSTLPALDF